MGIRSLYERPVTNLRVSGEVDTSEDDSRTSL